MAFRGRTSTVRRGVLPNLSLAGKREEKTAPVVPKKKKSCVKENRGGRGRGRGSHGGFERPSLIESSGIFSEGLSGADPSRRTRSVKSDLSEQYVPSPSCVKEEPVSELDPEKVPSSYFCYDELWASDDEEDIQALRELISDGFISDFKHGTVLPHVLPVELESQFIDLMHKDVKQNILDQEEDMKMEINLDAKEHILGDFVDDQEDDGESPTSKRSRKAARILRDMRKESRGHEFFMIQLPSVLRLLCQEKRSEENVVFHSIHSNGNPKPVCGDALLNSHERTAVQQLSLPPGRSIGKLLVTKSGRVLLRIGGHSMDVAHTTSEGHHQTLVMVETKSSARERLPVENGVHRYGSWSGGGDGKGAVYYIGNVRHHFTASLDWKSLRPIGLEKSSSTISNPSSSSRKIRNPVEEKRMKEELIELQQQLSVDIANALSRWSA
ncbi:hypothetical protein Angca_001139 [Angiostrongylus cantonensis]|nr:hypothetical protein Angca_001139 [Angiostrongylus cantonensis]